MTTRKTTTEPIDLDEPLEMEAGFEDAATIVKENESVKKQTKSKAETWQGELPVFNDDKSRQDYAKTGTKDFVVIGRGVRGVPSLSPVRVKNVCDESEAIRIYFWTLRRLTTRYSPWVCSFEDWQKGKRP